MLDQVQVVQLPYIPGGTPRHASMSCTKALPCVFLPDTLCDIHLKRLHLFPIELHQSDRRMYSDTYKSIKMREIIASKSFQG